MRILVVTPMLPSPAAPQFGIFVARQVDALRRAGAEVDVVAIDDPRTGRLRTPAKYAGLGARVLLRALRRRPDVIVAHMLVPPGLLAAVAGRAARRPVVLVAHGQDVTNAERSPRLRGLTARALRGASLLVAVSEELAARLAAVSPPPCPVLVLDVGVDRAAFAPGDRDAATAAACRARGVAPPGRPLVVQVGNLIERKNPERLAEAVAQLRARHPDATLWLAGDGPLAARLRGREASGVVLLGVVPPAEVGDVLRAADVAALVALAEGYGLGALEAVACGVPTVVSTAAPVAVDLPSTAAIPVRPDDVPSIAGALERALALPRDDPAGQAAADAHAVDAQAARLLDALRGLRRG